MKELAFKYTEEEMQRILKYIENELNAGKRNVDIREELGLPYEHYAKFRKEVHVYRNCKICGKIFEYRRFDETLCSSECRKQNHLNYTREKARMAKERKEKGEYVKDTSYSKRIEDREYTTVSIREIVISDFEGMSIKEMSDLYGRTEKSIQNKLNELKASGRYNKIIKRWSQIAPLMYKRALEKREKVTS